MFLTSLENVLLLLAMAVPGFIVAKLKMLKSNEAAINFISVMLLYICQPFITFNSFLNTDYNPVILWNMLAVFVMTTLLMVGLSMAAKLVLSKSRDPEIRSMVPYASVFGNVGYLCIPFLQILVPGDNVVILYATCSIVAFNLTAWTLGNYILTGDKQFIKLKKAILNPPALSFILALPLFILNLNFNRSGSLDGIAKVCRLFAELVGPLSMTLLGIKFSEMKLKEIFTDLRVYLSSGIKLVISPLLGISILLLASLFMDIEAVRLNIVAFAAMPTATNLMMFSSLYGKDVKLSAKMVMLSTLLSILTIPLALGLADKIFGA